MPLRWLSLLLVLFATAASAGDVPRWTSDGDARELRRGRDVLRVEVVGVPDRARNEELHRWVEETAEATLAAFGRFPLPEARVRVSQISSNDESPVPWGQTSRRERVSVLLYVRNDASYDELLDDWTAIHELSHLFHPYLGGNGRWLAEGLASYYQNVLRARAGLLDEAEGWRRLDAGFERGRNEVSGRRLDELSRNHRGTMRVYWGGAAYWLEADLALRRERGMGLDEALSRYSQCCLSGNDDVAPGTFVLQLDRIAGSRVFVPLYEQYAASREFPSLAGAYAELGLDTRDGDLRLSKERGKARLRRAIMGRRR